MPVHRPVSRPLLEALESRIVPSTSHRILEVHQGDPHAQYRTIQAAVNAARPGDEVRIFSGTYRETVTVRTPNLTLDAAAGASVTLLNPGKKANGIDVEGTPGHPLVGFTLARVAVSNFKSNGVFLLNVSHFTLSHVTAAGNGEYGLFPVLSSQGVIDHCTASGSNDTGIYVGQSREVVIRSSVAHDNVNGFEVENSSNVRTVNNNAFDNTVGILVDLLPAAVVAVPGYAPVESSSGNIVASNRVFANNRPNSAPAGDLAAVEPGGAGIVVVGGDRTLVEHNDVFANAYGGIVLLSGTDLVQLSPGTPGYSHGVDSNPNSTQVLENTLDLNGYAPPHGGFPPPSDLIWTGGGSNDHWRGNHFESSFPDPLP